MAEEHKLTKKEKKELRKLEWQEKAKTEQRNAQIKKYSIWVAGVGAIILIIGGLIMLVSSPSSTNINQIANVAPVSAKDITNSQNKAKVTLIEYSDFQCPACAAYHPIVTQLLTEYEGKIYFVYRIFPLTRIHPNAKISSRAAYAAYKQNKFFEMSDLLFNGQKDWSSESDPSGIFIDYAKSLKLDAKKFEDDMNSDEAKKYVDDSENQATSEGINSTPTFILNGVKIKNPTGYDEFKKLIENELNKK